MGFRHHCLGFFGFGSSITRTGTGGPHARRLRSSAAPCALLTAKNRQTSPPLCTRHAHARSRHAHYAAHRTHARHHDESRSARAAAAPAAATGQQQQPHAQPPRAARAAPGLAQHHRQKRRRRLQTPRTNDVRRTTTKRCCVPTTRAQSRRRRSMGYGDTGPPPPPPRQRGRRPVPPMRAWLTQPHGRRHKAPPQPCALTTIYSDETAAVVTRHAHVRVPQEVVAPRTTDHGRQQRTTNDTRRVPIALVYGRSEHSAPPVGGYRPRGVAPLARGRVAVHTPPGGRRAAVLSESRAL